MAVLCLHDVCEPKSAYSPGRQTTVASIPSYANGHRLHYRASAVSLSTEEGNNMRNIRREFFVPGACDNTVGGCSFNSHVTSCRSIDDYLR